MLRQYSLLYSKKILFTLIAMHITIIAASNYLVQLPFTIETPLLTFTTTPGAFTYPLIFLTTDLTVRLYGSTPANKIIYSAMLPALILSYIISIYFEGGVFVNNDLYFKLDIFRIAFASFTAYALGQLFDVIVFSRFRKVSAWWVAPALASIFASALDTLIFFFIAFFKADNTFMADNWFKIGVADYCTKIIIAALLLIPLYRVLLGFIVKAIKKRYTL